ncbi:MAG: hypothetical protein HOB29_12075 [Planctomycetaceae bacterium]|nr:hypothetical protein [Planctomycetaceae bacterium]MBT5123602.1 hypothetical protein [Planctomycetaceae bacterium]
MKHAGGPYSMKGEGMNAKVNRVDAWLARLRGTNRRMAKKYVQFIRQPQIN